MLEWIALNFPDNIIRVWRVYPFAEEVLVALMSLFCTNTPVHMSVIKLDLCVALQNPATAAFTVVLFNLVEKGAGYHLVIGAVGCMRSSRDKGNVALLIHRLFFYLVVCPATAGS